MKWRRLIVRKQASRPEHAAFTLVELPVVSRRESRAFTLVELLVVVAIIALLVTILMPSLGRALELTRKMICQTRLHTMGRGWTMYFST